MDQKTNEQKTAQILYITIILALLILAVTVGLVTAANKAKAPVVTAEITTPSTEKVPAVTKKQPEVTTTATTEPPAVTTEKKAPLPEITTKLKPTVAEPKVEPMPSFIMPTAGNISAKFSIDTLVFSNTMEDYRTHNGIDVCAPIGSAVCAVSNGVVSKVYEHPMMGYTVVISHDGGAESIYHNLADEGTVSVGDIVKCGDVIGAVGESAIIEIAEEPHLHFEMCIEGVRVDPLEYIDASQAVMSYDE